MAIHAQEAEGATAANSEVESRRAFKTVAALVRILRPATERVERASAGALDDGEFNCMDATGSRDP